jgi:SagB-type dehydrogenase family enzyme
LRSNPSSGNLHPTEGYVVIGAVPGLTPGPGTYHYVSKDHLLEQRAACSVELYDSLMKTLPPQAFIFGLTSVHWREAWKYGERAYRYCQHDAGHAIGAARIAAATLGWRMVVLDDVSDDSIETLLGIGRESDYQDAEREHPDCLAVIWPVGTGSGVAGACPAVRGQTPEEGGQSPVPLFLDTAVVEAWAQCQWYGKANRLSRDHEIDWEIIDEVAEAAWKPENERRLVAMTAERADSSTHHASPITRHGAWHRADAVAGPTAGQIIRQRRSAVAFDWMTFITRDVFYQMLSRVLPRAEWPQAQRPMPWDAIHWEPTIHLALFVHLVHGISPGLYLLARDRAKVPALRQAMHPHFLWQAPAGCPEELPLYLLEEGDARRLAAQVSCHQEIAGAGAFSLGMLAEFDESLDKHGPWFYRRLFWETGMIGQVLYLEAEAAGVRATGIGCFFDDPVHQVFGLKDTRFQSLYHFTVGGPVEDERLTTLPAYPS